MSVYERALPGKLIRPESPEGNDRGGSGGAMLLGPELNVAGEFESTGPGGEFEVIGICCSVPGRELVADVIQLAPSSESIDECVPRVAHAGQSPKVIPTGRLRTPPAWAFATGMSNMGTRPAM